VEWATDWATGCLLREADGRQRLGTASGVKVDADDPSVAHRKDRAAHQFDLRHAQFAPSVIGEKENDTLPEIDQPLDLCAVARPRGEPVKEAIAQAVQPRVCVGGAAGK